MDGPGIEPVVVDPGAGRPEGTDEQLEDGEGPERPRSVDSGAETASEVGAETEAGHEGGDDQAHRVETHSAVQDQQSLPGDLIDEGRRSARQEEETGQVFLTVPKESDVRLRRDSLPRWRIRGGVVKG